MPNSIDNKTLYAKESRTSIFGNVRYYNQVAKGRVTDLSATGMSLELGGPLHASSGSRVHIDSADLGIIEGTVLWRRDGQMRIEMHLSSNSLAKVSSYFRFFHQDVQASGAPA